MEASLCLRESDIENIKAKRSLLLRFNMALKYDDIYAHIWSLWIDNKKENMLRNRADEENIEIVSGKDLFYIDGEYTFKNN